MAIKCDCGYEPKFPAEFAMLDQWGCAKARMSSQGFGRSVVLCSTTDRAEEEAEHIVEDPKVVQDLYKEMVENNKKKPNANTKRE